MKRYPDQLTGWKPGKVAFYLDSADVDTIQRINTKSRTQIDMREHEKLRAAVIADLHISASIDENT